MGIKSPLSPVLILVHPGSLCGSADFNLGKDDGRAAREAVAREITAWRGSMMVLHGELSDELEDHPELSRAIHIGVRRATNSELTLGGFGCQLEADDPYHSKCALVELDHRDTHKDTPIHITGAWFDPSNKSGCINALRDSLCDSGYGNVTVSLCAAQLSFADEDTPRAPTQGAQR